jgi:hypothetical protein
MHQEREWIGRRRRVVGMALLWKLLESPNYTPLQLDWWRPPKKEYDPFLMSALSEKGVVPLFSGISGP